MRKLAKKILFILYNIKLAIKSLAWHKNPSIVLMGSWFGEKFADNSRFLFQYLSENKKSLGLTHVVWVSRFQNVVDTLHDMGYEAYLMGSEESINYHKKAKYHIICNASGYGFDKSADIQTEYSWNAKRINLWHGVGVVKGVGCESNKYLMKKEKNKVLYAVIEFLRYRSSLFRKFWALGGWLDCAYVSPTLIERSKMQKELLLPDEHFIMTGYARNCQCALLTDYEKKVIRIIKSYKKTIIYMPTFKTDTNNFDFRTIGSNLIPFLEENNILWIQKGHSADKFSSGYFCSGHILNLSSDFDTNTILPYISILITDYSSAMMDALYHQKPVLLYVPDYDVFLKGERGLIPEANDIMSGCGYIYKDINLLKRGIINAFNNPESAKPANYYKTRLKYWGKEKKIDEIWKDIIQTTE